VQLVEQGRAALGADVDHEAVAELRQGEVEAPRGTRPGAPAGAEAVAAGVGAVDGQHERLLANLRVPRLRLATERARVVLSQHAVQHRQRRQLARPDAEQGQVRDLGRAAIQQERLPFHVKLEEGEIGGEKIALGTIRADHELKGQIRLARNDTISARSLFVDQPEGQLVGRLQRLQGDRVVDQAWAEDGVALPAKPLDQPIQRRAGQEELFRGRWRGPAHVESLPPRAIGEQLVGLAGSIGKRPAHSSCPEPIT